MGKLRELARKLEKKASNPDTRNLARAARRKLIEIDLARRNARNYLGDYLKETGDLLFTQIPKAAYWTLKMVYYHSFTNQPRQWLDDFNSGVARAM
jgi:hypothetical protein